MFSYGVFFGYLESEFSWSRTLLSSASSIAFFCMGVLAIAGGRLSDRYGPRLVLIFTGVCTASAYCFMYFLSAPWQLLLIYSMLVGIGLSTHDVVTLSTIAKRFPRRRGIMSGVVKVGAAFGQITVPLIALALIGSYGWRNAFLLMGLSAFVLLVLAAWLIGIKPAGAQSQYQTVSEKPGLDFTEARGTRQLWTLCAMQFLFFSSLTTVPTHIVPHGMDSGMSAAVAASVLSAIAASSIGGRLVIGMLVDKIGVRRGFLISVVPLCLSLVSLVFIQDPKFLYGFAVFYGFAHGGLFTVVSPTVAEYFGMKAHGVIFGTILFFGTFGGAAMPIVAGMIFDEQGSYLSAFIVLAVMSVVGFFLACTLSPPQLQKKAVIA
ncbi:hypothetical protein AB833_27440 [Chromatiales bacterium (ex Bugula neritina AB1)]|nr:hypothetical protein AB833_27440 [Chromatiales bacterium (ex Bugula neritina AB1)]